MLANRKPFVVISLGMCKCWIMMLGNRFEGWPTSQKPLIIRKIWPSVRRCLPDSTSFSGAALFSLASHNGRFGHRAVVKQESEGDGEADEERDAPSPRISIAPSL